jgi:type II secretory pathway component PulM
VSGRPSNARERRTIAWGAAIAAAALFLAFVVMPVARRWSAREDAIAAARDRVARLQGLLATGVAPLPSTPARVIRGRTSDLAGSALQSTLQQLARTSRVSVDRLDVQADTTDPAATGVRAALSATTDIYGVADLLSRVQGHTPVLVTEELTLTMNPVLRGNLIAVTLGIRAPWVPAS